MSSHWKPIIRYIRDEIADGGDKYDDIIIHLYCVIQDYIEKDIDIITDDDMITTFERHICKIDPEWAETSITCARRCERCAEVFISEDYVRHRLKLGDNIYQPFIYCKSCWDIIEPICSVAESDDEEDLDELVEDHIERQAELLRNK